MRFPLPIPLAFLLILGSFDTQAAPHHTPVDEAESPSILEYPYPIGSESTPVALSDYVYDDSANDRTIRNAEKNYLDDLEKSKVELAKLEQRIEQTEKALTSKKEAIVKIGEEYQNMIKAKDKFTKAEIDNKMMQVFNLASEVPRLEATNLKLKIAATELRSKINAVEEKETERPLPDSKDDSRTTEVADPHPIEFLPPIGIESKPVPSEGAYDDLEKSKAELAELNQKIEQTEKALAAKKEENGKIEADYQTALYNHLMSNEKPGAEIEFDRAQKAFNNMLYQFEVPTLSGTLFELKKAAAKLRSKITAAHADGKATTKRPHLVPAEVESNDIDGLEKSKAELAELNQKIEQTEKALATQKAEKGKIEEDYRSAMYNHLSEMEKPGAKAELDRAQKAYFELTFGVLSQTLDELKTAAAKLTSKIQQYQQKADHFDSDLQIKELRWGLETRKYEYEQLKKAYDSKWEQLDGIKRTYEAENQLTKLKKEMDRVKHEMDSLKRTIVEVEQRSKRATDGKALTKRSVAAGPDSNDAPRTPTVAESPSIVYPYPVVNESDSTAGRKARNAEDIYFNELEEKTAQAEAELMDLDGKITEGRSALAAKKAAYEKLVREYEHGLEELERMKKVDGMDEAAKVEAEHKLGQMRAAVGKGKQEINILVRDLDELEKRSKITAANVDSLMRQYTRKSEERAQHGVGALPTMCCIMALAALAYLLCAIVLGRKAARKRAEEHSVTKDSGALE